MTRVATQTGLSREDTYEAILTLWAAIVNWQDDRACNLLPTEGSLQRAREAAEKALARNGTPIVHEHEPVTPISDSEPFKLYVLDDAGRDVEVVAR